jgi:hypothetical protein
MGWPALLCSLAAMGLAVGVLTGLFGVGGGFIITPLMNLLLGIPYSCAVGSSLSFTIGTSAAGAMRHQRLGNVEPKSVVILAGASVPGAVLGAMLHEGLLNWLTRSGRDDFTPTMHGLFVVVLLLTAWLVVRGPIRDEEGFSLLQRLPLPPHVHLPGANLAHVSLLGLCLAGWGIGVMKGLLGIGGGVLFMPLLLVVVGLGVHQAVGTSLGVVLFSSIAGTVRHAAFGNVNLWVVMALLVGSTIGIQVGAWLCHRLRAERICRYFTIILLLVAAALLWDIAHRLLA